MAEYRLAPRARRDLDEVFDHTVTEWGLLQAARYIDLISAACADLAEAPQRAQGCEHIRPGYRRRGVERHIIYFRPTSYGIAVIRILHQRMDAARHLWRKARLPNWARPRGMGGHGEVGGAVGL